MHRRPKSTCLRSTPARRQRRFAFRRATSLIVFAVVGSFGWSARSETIRVPGDVELVRDALAIAVAGDTLLLAAQYHPTFLDEPLLVPAGVCVLGDGSASEVVWNVRPGLEFPANSCGVSPEASVERVTLLQSTFIGQPIVLRQPNATLRGCNISDDTTAGGSIRVLGGGRIEGCSISASVNVAGVGSSTIERNVFSGCLGEIPDVALDITLAGAHTLVRNNTFLGNTPAITLAYSEADTGSATLVNNIFNGDGILPGRVQCLGFGGTTPDLDVRYNLFGYGEGTWSGLSDCPVVVGPGNLLDEIPMFCDVWSCDYHLDAESPAVGTGEDGVTMGALAVACGEISAVQPVHPNAHLLLSRAAPNPSAGSVALRFDSVSDPATLSASILDVAGRRVATATIIDNTIYWQPHDSIRPGTYFVLLRDMSTGATQSRKVQLID